MKLPASGSAEPPRRRQDGSEVGGSLGGGGDHIQAAPLAKSQGVAPGDLNHVPTGGGGETVSLLLSGAATASFTEVREQFQAGSLKALTIALEADGPKIEGVEGVSFAALGLRSWRARALRAHQGPAASDRRLATEDARHALLGWYALAQNTFKVMRSSGC
jgi:hypothetical protein